MLTSINQFEVPYLDRHAGITRGELGFRVSDDMWTYRENGFVILKNFIPPHLLTDLENESSRFDLFLYRPLLEFLRDVLGDDVGLERSDEGLPTYHQEESKQPDSINSWCLSVYFAVTPSEGIQLIPKSHRIGVIKRSVYERENPKEIDKFFDKEIKERRFARTKYQGQPGDIVVLNPRLVRRSLGPVIFAHYSGLRERDDLPSRRQHRELGSWYFLPPGEEE